MKPVIIGSDHAGFDLKKTLIQWLTEKGVAVEDQGCYDLSSVDYPDFAGKVGHAVAAAEGAQLGVLICGTGIGISIAANKVHGVRAALCHSVFDAEMCRRHNDANILCLGSRTTTETDALAFLERYLTVPFEGGRHARRVAKIHALED